jgi:hypothetical protein
MPRIKQPVSDKQLAANRANAAQSTGPRSPEGKARSALNSRKHGFTASTFAVVRLEDIDEVGKLREDAIAVYATRAEPPSIPKVFLAILAFFARNNVFSSSIESPSAAPAEQTRYWAVSQVPTLAPNRLPKPPARCGAGGGCTIVDSRGNCPKSDVVTPD